MKLADLKRFCNTLVPGGLYIGRRKLPRMLLGLTSGRVIFYAAGLGERQRDLTILHEVAHVLFDSNVRGTGDAVRDIQTREQWREDRADRWAAETLALLEGCDPCFGVPAVSQAGGVSLGHPNPESFRADARV